MRYTLKLHFVFSKTKHDNFNERQPTIIVNEWYDDEDTSLPENAKFRKELTPLPEESEEEVVEQAASSISENSNSDLDESNEETIQHTCKNESPQNNDSANLSDIVDIEIIEGLQLITEPEPLPIQSNHELATFEMLKSYEEEVIESLFTEEEFKIISTPTCVATVISKEKLLKYDSMIPEQPEIIQTKSLQSIEDDDDSVINKEKSSSFGRKINFDTH